MALINLNGATERIHANEVCHRALYRPVDISSSDVNLLGLVAHGVKESVLHHVPLSHFGPNQEVLPLAYVRQLALYPWTRYVEVVLWA